MTNDNDTETPNAISNRVSSQQRATIRQQNRHQCLRLWLSVGLLRTPLLLLPFLLLLSFLSLPPILKGLFLPPPSSQSFLPLRLWTPCRRTVTYHSCSWQRRKPWIRNMDDQKYPFFEKSTWNFFMRNLWLPQLHVIHVRLNCHRENEAMLLHYN